MPKSQDAASAWLKLLDPSSLRANLVAASIYILAYELLVRALVEPLRGFFGSEFDGAGRAKESNEYREAVLALDTRAKDPTKRRADVASILWFRNAGALADEDIEILGRIKKHRHEVAHETMALVSDAKRSVNLDLLNDIVRINNQIESWWLVNVEAEVNPEFDSFTTEEVAACSSLQGYLLELLASVAQGDDSRLSEIHAAMLAHATGSHRTPP